MELKGFCTPTEGADQEAKQPAEQEKIFASCDSDDRLGHARTQETKY